LNCSADEISLPVLKFIVDILTFGISNFLNDYLFCCLGADAAEVGEIVAEPAESVVLRTGFGGTRIVDMLVGDPLPRIC